MTLLGHILYINLDRCTDRRQQMEAELVRVGLSGERISGLDTGAKPVFGITYSHAIALRHARSCGWPYVLILEDDATFTVDRAELERQAANPFDVLTLHGDRAYLVAAHYYTTLIERLEATFAALFNVQEPTRAILTAGLTYLQKRHAWVQTAAAARQQG